MGYLQFYAQLQESPIAQRAQALRVAFRWCGDGLDDTWKQEAVTTALLYHQNEYVDTVRELVGEPLFSRAAVKVKEGFLTWHSKVDELCSPLFWASLRGDMPEVERLLAQGERPDEYTSARPANLTPARAAAERGHTAIAVALLAALGDHPPEQGHPSIRAVNHRDVVEILAVSRQRNNIAMAVAVISALDIPSYLKYRSYEHEPILSASECAMGTPEFFKAVLSTMSSRLHKAGQKICLGWLINALRTAFLVRDRQYVQILLDELDKDKTGIFSTRSLPFEMRDVLQSGSASVLRMVLVRYPEASINDEQCDPVTVLQAYRWPAGARLLLEAGAEVKRAVPSQHAKLLALSLEDRCRIAARRCIRLPLSQSVEQLPLPSRVKRHFLYLQPNKSRQEHAD